MSEKEISPETNNTNADRCVGLMVSGLLWAIGGSAVTYYTYQAAADGGIFIIAWGAIVFGIWDFLKGLFGLMFSSDSDEAVEHSQDVESDAVEGQPQPQ